MADNQDIPEEYIEVALRYLKYHDPEHCSREDAIGLLKDLQTGYHEMSTNDPEKLLELKKQLDERKDNKYKRLGN